MTGNNVFDRPMTYSGLLDDVVDRFRITPEVDTAFFNRSIVRNVFFSGRIFINDGYLVNHPAALGQLLNEDSLLRTMIKNGFVEVLARQKDPTAFAENPERMAQQGVKSFEKLVRRSDWPQLKARIRTWAEGLYTSRTVAQWPPYRMDAGFRQLFSRVFDKTPADLGLSEHRNLSLAELQERYEKHERHSTAPRTAVEEASFAMMSRGVINKDGRIALMNIANQCYHYNFALCLSEATGKAVAADTTIGAAFEDILDLPDSVEAELDNVPVLAIPKGFPIDDGSHFDKLLDHGTQLSHAKHVFLSSMDEVFRSAKGRSVDDSVKMLRESAEAYRRYLTEHFSDRIGLKDWAPRRNAIISFGFGMARGMVVAADEAMLAANLVGGRRVSSFMHKLTKKARKRILGIALDPEAGERNAVTFKVGDVRARPRFASLAFDQTAAKSHVATLPRID